MTLAEYFKKMQEQQDMQKYESTILKGKTLLEWAVIWFHTSNDSFYQLYGFNFNPHDYKGLYLLARKQVYGY